MSTASLPSYAVPLGPSFSRTPSYSAEPGLFEERLALNTRLPHYTGSFVKSSKSGDGTLRLTAQQDKIDLPVYGSGGVVEGTVELTKTEDISNVEVKIEGRFQVKEIAEGGETDTKLRLDTALLWIKDASNSYEGRSYPLPPSHSIKLKGLPGFYATIDYSVSAVINKPHSVPNLVPLVKSKKLGINIGNTTVSTPFVYAPRTRPAVPLPAPLARGEGGFLERPDWRVYQSVLKASSKAGGAQDINVRLYFPASRIFCASQPIPFHVTFESSAYSLAAFLPYGPTTGKSGKLRATRIQLMRQSTVDVRGTAIHGTKTDIWRVDSLGEGKFRHAGDGATWMAFSGEIELEPIKVMGFAIAGFSVKDCILLTVTPPDVTKAAFISIRETIPVRLTTDAFTQDGRGIAAARQSMTVPPSPESFSDDGSPARAL